MATPVPHPEPIIHLVTCGTCYSRSAAHSTLVSRSVPNPASPYPSFNPAGLEAQPDEDLYEDNEL